MPKKKTKPCNLTKKEWNILHQVFGHYSADFDSLEDEKMLDKIHMKIFFMDALIKNMEE